MSYRILLEKENFKFSASHFTVFGPEEAERLHGHNYYVVSELEVNSLDEHLGMAFDFNLIKPIIREITGSLDEYVLIPERSPWLAITRSPSSVKVEFGAKTYVLPIEDVKFIPATNVTSEELARHIANQLFAVIQARAPLALSRLTAIRIGVEETRGQTVLYELSLSHPAQSAQSAQAAQAAQT